MLPELSTKFPELRQKLLKPFIININPNVVSVVALLVAIAAGYFLWQNLLLPAAAFVLLNGFLDMYAPKTKRICTYIPVKVFTYA